MTAVPSQTRHFAANSNVAQRIGAAVERLLSRLKARSPHREKFLFQHVADRRVPDAFQIAEKCESGESKDGSNWITHRGPSQKQLQVMESTSSTLDEFVTRLENFVFHGVDTTRQVGGPQASVFDEESINKLVTARLQALLSDPETMRKVRQQGATEQTVAQVVESRDFDKLPKGIRKPKSNEQHRLSVRAMAKREEKLVKERCDILGVPHDKIQYNGDGSINRIWMRSFEAKWEGYCAMHPNAVQRVVQQEQAPPAPETPPAA